MSTAIEIVAVLLTPLVISDVPEAAALNTEIPSHRAAFQHGRLAVELGHGPLGWRAGWCCSRLDDAPGTVLSRRDERISIAFNLTV